MTEEELQAIDAALARATPGPLTGGAHVPWDGEAQVYADGPEPIARFRNFHDAMLFSGARRQIEALVAEVRRLRATPREVWAIVGVDDGVPYEDPGREEVISLHTSEASARRALELPQKAYDSYEVRPMVVTF